MVYRKVITFVKLLVLSVFLGFSFCLSNKAKYKDINTPSRRIP